MSLLTGLMPDIRQTCCAKLQTAWLGLPLP
jgi:hypothetical protein